MGRTSPLVNVCPRGCRPRGTGRRLVSALLLLLLVLLGAGCAKYNIYYNAKKSFDEAEHAREEAIKKNQDPPPPTGAQKARYDTAIEKSQRVLDEYPGHSLSDDALFLQAKSWHRLESYRMSIRKLDLLFQNFPATPYEEEALYLQGLNYLLIGAIPRSQDYLDQLVRKHPDSEYRAEVMKVTGDNAYDLESWEEAADAYRQYLDQDVAIKERDRIGIKLAESYWELEEHEDAAVVLQEISETAESQELRFRALLLLARVHVRMGDHEAVDALLDELRTEAVVYKARGEVNLIEAENLIAQGRADEATPLLENMPAEWAVTPAVKARAEEILGHQYLARGKWAESRTAFRQALNRPKDLEDEDEVRRLSDHLNVFLAAVRAVTDAPPPDVARNRLLIANSFRFGFDRPERAADYYSMAARDSAAESTVAARALYGAYLTYRDDLDLPDSAAVFAAELDSIYPDSPQAYEARLGGTSDLLGYLLELREKEQAANYAALSDSERVALSRGIELGPGTIGSAVVRDHQLRRRLVYLQQRENLLFPPTEAELALHRSRLADRERDDARAAAADTVGGGTPVITDPAQVETGVPPPPPGAEIGGTGTGGAAVGPDGEPLTDDGARGTAEGTGEGDGEGEGEGEGNREDDEEDEEEDGEEKKKDTFDLRAPGPRPGPGE